MLLHNKSKCVLSQLTILWYTLHVIRNQRLNGHLNATTTHLVFYLRNLSAIDLETWQSIQLNSFPKWHHFQEQIVFNQGYFICNHPIRLAKMHSWKNKKMFKNVFTIWHSVKHILCIIIRQIIACYVKYNSRLTQKLWKYNIRASMTNIFLMDWVFAHLFKDLEFIFWMKVEKFDLKKP